ncbi:MAG TPA: ABC transporter ATP-binding protein [Ktedonobacteraceae bacterium]|nr:ABC transporter ATP-binding protein [Ktedonobacteraceae bacterium]
MVGNQDRRAFVDTIERFHDMLLFAMRISRDHRGIFEIEHSQIGLLAGYIQALYLVYNNTQSLVSNLSQLYEHTLYIKNLFEFLDITPTRIKSGSLSFPQRLSKGIEFRHVSFSYPGTTDAVLHDLNLFFPARECVALVGHNGAGKTTLVKLLARLYEPTEGQIFIDDIPLEAYDLQDLRKHISVIFQDFVHYEMTVQENIGFGYVAELENSERVQCAARESGIAQTVEGFPQLYQTTLGRMFEDGQELSLGQWQKVALARAFMRRAPIVILDEPTASMDAEAETEVFGRLREIAQGATTLLIAHRFSTVRMADRILVLEHGQVVEEGTHESLLHANGTYAHLFHLQAAGYVNS